MSPGEERPFVQNVLIVDDDEQVRLSLQSFLEDEGLKVRVASNGAEALDRLNTEPPPDVILLDLLMPVVDGWQFLRECSDRRAGLSIPIIALSAVSYRGAPGAVAVLPKPINTDNLLALIRQVGIGGSGRDGTVAEGGELAIHMPR